VRELVYHVACSVDGFIGHTDGRLDGFLMDGPHADDYLAALRDDYDAVVMGRRTYEAGYAFGAEPGAPTYREFGLSNHIVSTTLPFDSRPGFEVIRSDPATRVAELKEFDGRAIYLCGGAELAGHLLDAGLIDRLLLKVNPFVMGTGTPLFGGDGRTVTTVIESVHTYPNGVLLIDQRLGCAGSATPGETSP
jgi:dihydrofolate reductase